MGGLLMLANNRSIVVFKRMVAHFAAGCCPSHMRVGRGRQCPCLKWKGRGGGARAHATARAWGKRARAVQDTEERAGGRQRQHRG